MKATCACGQASVTVNAMPTMHGVCHCTNCKRRTGSAFGISAYFERSAVTSVEGETKVYALHNMTYNHDQERHFCVRCGTTLYWTISTQPDAVGIAGGCFADGDLGEPTYSTHDGRCVAWVRLPERWERYAG